LFIEKLKLKNRIRRAHSRRDDPRFHEREFFLLEFLAKGGTAIDVGANKGLYAYGLAKVADRVLCFEANPALAKKLKRAVPANCRSKLHRNAAFGAHIKSSALASAHIKRTQCFVFSIGKVGRKRF